MLVPGIVAHRQYAAAPSYIAEAVNFNTGQTNYLSKSGTMSIPDGKVFTFSCWLKSQNSGDSIGRFFSAGYGASDNMFLITTRGPDDFDVFAEDSGKSRIVTLRSTNTYTDSDGWTHLLVSVDLAAGSGHLYVNGVDDEDTGVTSLTNANIYFTGASTWYVGRLYSNAASLPCEGDMAELWFTNEYVDLSVQSNREKFVSGTGASAVPVDLGSDGSTPTGTQPKVYFKGAASVWNAGTNAGSGGNFGMTGSVTDANSSEPVQGEG